MLRNIVAVFTLALTLTGCASVGGSYIPPVVDAPASFATDTPELQLAQAGESQWWNRFDDPVLASLIDEALGNNLDLREAVARVDAARAYRSEARQAYLPTGNLSASQTHGSVAREGERIATAGISVGWEVDLFGRVRSMNRAADARADATEALLAQAKIVVAAEVARTYFALRAAEAREAMLEHYSADQAEIVALIEARVEEGVDDEADLARARTVEAEDALALAGERHNIRVHRNALAVLIGRTPVGFEPPAAPELGPLTLEPIAIGDPASLLQRRPDVVAAERTLAAQTAEIGVATAGLFPQLSLGGVFGFAAGNFGDLGDSQGEAWFAGPTLTWGIFDLGRVRAKIRREKAESEGALAAYERTVLRALEDSQNAFSAYAAAQESLGATDAQVRNARLATDIVEAQYREGMTSYFDYLDARRSSVRAEIARIDSLAAHRAATIDVFRALGSI